MRKLIWILAAAASAGAQPVESPFAGSFLFQRAGRDTAGRAYESGQRALDRREWDQAVERFGEVAQAKGDRADGALYWKAYALNKLGRRDQALAAIDQLRKEYPSSRWLDDAKALALEVQQASGQKVAPEGQADEDMKLLALNTLMTSDPDRALPALEKVLRGSSSPKVKERALFVLAQSNAPKARDLLAQIARGAGNPDLQLKAINYLGVVAASDANRKLLADIYAGSNDTAVKRSILRAYMIGGDRERLLQAARTEKSPDLRMEAIQQLGISGGQDQLWQLYQAETSVDVKEKILRSMFVGGNSQRLLEIARTEKDPRLRGAAIHSLGIMGRRGGDSLAGLYGTETDPGVKRQIINGLFIQGNAKALVDVARKETNPELKKEIVSRLSHMHSKEAADYIMEVLNK